LRHQLVDLGEEGGGDRQTCRDGIDNALQEAFCFGSFCLFFRFGNLGRFGQEFDLF